MSTGTRVRPGYPTLVIYRPCQQVCRHPLLQRSLAMEGKAMQPGEEYDEAMVAALELLWGEGFLSPGGPAEIAEILKGGSIAGKSVLDIGCGIGGIDLLLATQYNATRVIGIDI